MSIILQLSALLLHTTSSSAKYFEDGSEPCRELAVRGQCSSI